jgi:hypothetical protein
MVDPGTPHTALSECGTVKGQRVLGLCEFGTPNRFPITGAYRHSTRTLDLNPPSEAWEANTREPFVRYRKGTPSLLATLPNLGSKMAARRRRSSDVSRMYAPLSPFTMSHFDRSTSGPSPSHVQAHRRRVLLSPRQVKTRHCLLEEPFLPRGTLDRGSGTLDHQQGNRGASE